MHLEHSDHSHVSSERLAHPNTGTVSEKYSAARIAGTYLIAGFLWIGLSDLTLAWSGGLTLFGFLVAVGKGLVFVLLSAGLVFALCLREYRNSTRIMGLLRAVVDGTTDAVFVKDKEGRYKLVNESAAKCIGLPVAEILGRDDRVFFSVADAECLIANDRAVMSSGKVITQDETLTAGGVTRTYHATKAPCFDPKGNINGLIGISRDITDRVLVESALRETEARLREAQRIAKLGSWSWSPQSDQVWWSDAEFELFGLAPEAVSPSFELFLSLLHPDDRQFAKARVEAMHAGSKEFADEMRIIRSDGTLMWILSQGRITRDSDGKLVRVEGIDQDITERKLAEAEMKSSEERYRHLFESNPHPMWVYDVESLRFLNVNDAAVQAYGYSRHEFLTMTILEIRSANEVAKLEADIADGMRGLRRYTNRKHRRKDGTELDVEISGHDLRDKQGRSRLVLALDITERKLAEDAREIAIQRLSKFASQLPGAIFLYRLNPDNSSCVPYASERIEAILGLRHERFSSDEIDPFSYVYADDCDAVKESISKSAMELTPFSGEFRVVDDSGATRWISCDAVPERELDGSTLWHGYMKEVTESHEAAIELEEAKVQLEEAQALARIGSWSYDEQTNVHHWSKQMYRIFSLEDSDAKTHYNRMLESIHPEDAMKLEEAVKTASGDGTPYSLVVRMQKADADVRYVRCEGRSRRDSRGKIVGLYGTSADVTAEVEREQALKAARNQADAANRAKSEFLANMSHEIRTPLTAILGFAEVMREDEKFAAPKHWLHDLDTIAGAGKHLLTIINDILDLSKIEADKTTLELIETPLIEIISEVVRLLSSNASGKGVLLCAKLLTPVPNRIQSDPTRLRQILMNLVGNAVKFTEAGTVEVNASVTEVDGHKFLTINIEDTGRGINTDQSQSLFQAFEQSDNTVSRKFGGTGLGLTISRRLAILLGGDVTLVRTELGKGSCFRLQIPLIIADGSEFANVIESKDIPGGDVHAGKPSLQGRILLAEDGIDNQRLISFILKKAGAAVDIAENGQVALEMLERANEQSTPFDLLLSDMQMPVMDGYMLARTLREKRVKLPIVALTAHALAEDRQKCIDAGCDDYLSKPIDKNALLSICAKWINTQR